MTFKVVVGFITYSEYTAKYLEYFLPSLEAQTYTNLEIIAVDHGEVQDNENSRFMKERYPGLDYCWVGENQGFARGFNRLIHRAQNKGADLFLAMNPDMILEPDAVEKLVATIRTDKQVGAVQPKILHWDFERKLKTDIIDSYGLFITRDHRFSDLRQGERDDKNVTEPYEVFGFTGAAVMLNLRALKDVAYKSEGKEEYFDSLMFMYKEDCDLSYRLRLAGYKIYFQPQAIVYHHRTASPKGESNLKIAANRLRKSKQVKKWSFLNHWILLLKIKDLKFSWSVKFRTYWYQFKSLVFILLFEQYLLKEFITLFKIRKKIQNRREQLIIRIDIQEIEKMMIK